MRSITEIRILILLPDSTSFELFKVWECFKLNKEVSFGKSQLLLSRIRCPLQTGSFWATPDDFDLLSGGVGRPVIESGTQPVVVGLSDLNKSRSSFSLLRCSLLCYHGLSLGPGSKVIVVSKLFDVEVQLPENRRLLHDELHFLFRVSLLLCFKSSFLFLFLLKLQLVVAPHLVFGVTFLEVHLDNY